MHSGQGRVLRHAAFLVLLAAAAGAGLVPSHFRHGPNGRLVRRAADIVGGIRHAARLRGARVGPMGMDVGQRRHDPGYPALRIVVFHDLVDAGFGAQPFERRNPVWVRRSQIVPVGLIQRGAEQESFAPLRRAPPVAAFEERPEAGRVGEECAQVLNRGDGLRGSHGHYRRASGAAPAEARQAITHIAPIVALAGATLVECRLETGRQHQIRIHLSEIGHPLVGERVYIRDYAGAKIDAPRPMLHARTLGFAHPRTGEPLLFQSEPPADFQAMVELLRR